jgi:integrase
VLTSFKDPKLGYFHSKNYTRNGVQHWTSTYYNEFYHKGKHHSIATGTADPDETRKIAKKKQQEITGKVARHEPVGTEANKIRVKHLREMDERFVAEKFPKNLRRVKENWAHLLNEDYGFSPKCRASDLSALDLDRYVDQRKAEGASSETVYKEINRLSRGYDLAIDKGLIPIGAKPTKFPELAKSKPRKGFFKESEVQNVISHTKDRLIRWIILFATLTGWRKSEIIGNKQRDIEPMKWNQVDFVAGEIRLDTSKNGEGRTFPFYPELKELMEQLRRYTDEVQQRNGEIIPWVFHREGKPIKEFRRSWKSACKAAGLPNRIFHDFRRSAVRNLVRAGIPAKTAMELTGHKTRSIFERYNITEGEDLVNAVARLAEYRDKQKEAAAKEQEKVAVGNFGS